MTLVPYLGPSGEQKTKPTQHSVTDLRSRGIQPDVIICRSDRSISTTLKRKISLLSDVPVEAVVSCMDAPNLYEIPLALHEEGLDTYVCRLLGFETADQFPPDHPLDLSAWQALVERVEAATRPVRIGLIGKYVNLPDAYSVGGGSPAPRGIRSTGPGSTWSGSRPRPSRASWPTGPSAISTG